MDEWTFEIADLYGRLREEQDIVRGLFAELIGASADEVAIVESTGMGSNLAVEMIEPRAGGNVVFDEWSYPSSIYPWTLPERAHVESDASSRPGTGALSRKTWRGRSTTTRWR